MKIKKIVAIVAFLTIFGLNSAYSQGLGNLLGGNLGQTLGNMLEGVFSSSNITIADMAGEWKSTGPAVCFQGEGFLKKAGGIAAAAAIETKLQPYYDQYGLNNAQLTIDKDGNFSLVCKAIRLNGNITRQESADQGVFEFNFTALGVKLSSVTTYVQKTSGTMDIMFDATKLKKLLSAISQFSGMTTVQTLTSILDSYDGLCVGFHLSYTGAVNGNSNTGTDTNQNITGGSILGNILGGLSGQDTTNGTTNQTNTNQTNAGQSNTQTQENGTVSTGIDRLKGVLGSRKKKK